MLRRTRVALAVTGVLAVAGLAVAAQPALAAGRGAAWAGGTCPVACQEGGCRAGAPGDGFVDADGNGTCDNREDGTCVTGERCDGAGSCDGTGCAARAGHGAGHHGGRCRW